MEKARKHKYSLHLMTTTECVSLDILYFPYILGGKQVVRNLVVIHPAKLECFLFALFKYKSHGFS